METTISQNIQLSSDGTSKYQTLSKHRAEFYASAKALTEEFERQIAELKSENIQLQTIIKTNGFEGPPSPPRKLPPTSELIPGTPPLPKTLYEVNGTPSRVVSRDETPRLPMIPHGGPLVQPVSTQYEDSPKSILSAKEFKLEMHKLDNNPHLETIGEPETTIIRKPSNRLFTDVDEMKNQIRRAALRPYTVKSFYYETGVCAYCARHAWFDLAMLGLVFFNSLWMAIDVDVNDAKNTKDKAPFSQIVDYFFFVVFTLEVLIRFGAFKDKLNCFRDYWFCFDTTLVVLMFIDTLLPYIASGNGLGFNTSIVRLARLIKVTRMGRIARLLKRWPEMSVLLQGLGIACRSVVTTLLLLVVVVYVFAVAFRYLTLDTSVGETYFRSTLFSMKVLTLNAVMPDSAGLVDDVGQESVILGVICALFIIVASVTLLNMLVGVLVEVIGVVSAMEKEEAKVHVVKDHLLPLLRSDSVDQNEDGFISKQEFQQMLLNGRVVKVLREVGVDPVGLIDFIDYIFEGAQHKTKEGVLTFDKTVEMICELGGSNKATVKNVVDMRQVVTRQLTAIEETLSNHGSLLESLLLMSKSIPRSSQFTPRLEFTV